MRPTCVKEDSWEAPGVLLGSSSAGPTECAVPMDSSQQLAMTRASHGENSQRSFFVPVRWPPAWCLLYRALVQGILYTESGAAEQALHSFCLLLLLLLLAAAFAACC